MERELNLAIFSGSLTLDERILHGFKVVGVSLIITWRNGVIIIDYLRITR